MNSSFVTIPIRCGRSALAVALGALLVACGGGGGDGLESPPPRFENTTVAGAAGLRDNQTGIVWAAKLGSQSPASGATEPTVAELWQLADMGAAALRPLFAFVIDAEPALIKASSVNTSPSRVWAVDFGVGFEPGGLSDQATPLPGDASPDVKTWQVLSRTRTPAAVVFPTTVGNGTVSAGGLTWKVCSEGSRWNGSGCVGSASRVRAGGAQALADAVNATGFAELKDWRVPTKQELRSLLQLDNPLSDSNLLPSVFAMDPLGVVASYWSSGLSVDGTRAWVVDFSGARDGDIGGLELVSVNEFAHVRLVRTPR